MTRMNGSNNVFNAVSRAMSVEDFQDHQDLYLLYSPSPIRVRLGELFGVSKVV